MSEGNERSDWQRRYDESLALERERERKRPFEDADDMTGGEHAVMEASYCLPWWWAVGLSAAAWLRWFLRRRALRRRG